LKFNVDTGGSAVLYGQIVTWPKYVGSEIEKWTRIAKAANVKVDY
jgi:hypothetical protein